LDLLVFRESLIESIDKPAVPDLPPAVRIVGSWQANGKGAKKSLSAVRIPFPFTVVESKYAAMASSSSE
jgi:hypothetical protein